MQDENYRDFHAKLIPNVDKETIIGVRVPHMRAYARTLWKQAPETARAFLEVLPHKYYEENCLHGLLIDTLAETTDEALRLIDRFLPQKSFLPAARPDGGLFADGLCLCGNGLESE